MSGGQLSNLYTTLESAVMPKNSLYKGYTAYYVTIIPKKSNRHNIEFIPSNKATGQKCASNPLIRQIDGASFYDMVTKKTDSLRNLFSVLPDVIQDISGISNLHKSELQNIFNIAYG